MFNRGDTLYVKIGGKVTRCTVDSDRLIGGLVPVHLDSGGVRVYEPNRLFRTKKECENHE